MRGRSKKHARFPFASAIVSVPPASSVPCSSPICLCEHVRQVKSKTSRWVSPARPAPVIPCPSHAHDPLTEIQTPTPTPSHPIIPRAHSKYTMRPHSTHDLAAPKLNPPSPSKVPSMHARHTSLSLNTAALPSFTRTPIPTAHPRVQDSTIPY